jgi:tRNA-dihydrouridine synthase A
MLGRVAYHDPGVLAEVDGRFYGASGSPPELHDVVERMIPYVERVVAEGGRVAHVTRHMIGLFHGHPGARQWRRILTVEGAKAGAGPEVLRHALASLRRESAAEPVVTDNEIREGAVAA